LATLALSLLLVVFLVFVFYLSAMRFMDMERFRDVILYFQIGMSILVFGFYQVAPRIIKFSELKQLTLEDRWWIYLYPPTWMAAPLELLSGERNTQTIFLSLLAFVVPLCCLAFVIRVLAPGFTRILGGMQSSAAAGEGSRRREERRGFLARLFSRRFTHRGEERAAFDLLWATAGRDRAFKLATYPGMAMVVIVTGMMIITQLKDAPLEELVDSSMYLFPLYFASFMAPTALIQMRYSEFHEAAWIYHALPLRRPGAVLSASLKVVLLRFALPLYLIIGITVVCLWGTTCLWDIALGVMVMIGFLLATAFSLPHQLPFSQARAGATTGQGVIIMLLLIVLALLGLGHWGLKALPFGVPAAVVVLIFLELYGFSRYRRTPWYRLE
jgi:hypothetical protein